MLKLRKILLSNYFYLLIFLIFLPIFLIRLSHPHKPSLPKNTTDYTGQVQKYTILDNKLTLYIKNKETLLATYYFPDKKATTSFSKNIKLGDTLKLSGTLLKPKKNTTKYLFNYQKYLSTKKIYYLFQITSYQKLSSSTNLYYLLKNKIVSHLNKNPYLSTFIIGDKSFLNKEVLTSFQTNGISHLFAISGMHITLLTTIILKILSLFKIKENNRYYLTIIFLLFYLSLTDISPSILRGVLFFILFSLNNIFYFHITNLNLFRISLIITLSINPFYIYDLGFQYSYTISFYLLYLTSSLKNNSYLKSLLKISLISSLASLPITLANFYEFNFLSIFYNLFYVPLITFIIFPLSLLTFLCPKLLFLYNFFISILEKSSLFFSHLSFGKIAFYRLPTFVYLLYFIFIFLLIVIIKYPSNKKYFPLLFFFLLIHYLYPYLFNKTYLLMLDVNQGDSFLLHSKNSSVLIDTGGLKTYNYQSKKQESSNNITKNTTIPLLKTLAIKELSALILTHGDFDHMGEALNIINNFKVKQVIFNCGSFNYLEKNLIKVLNKKNIPYYSCIEKLPFPGNDLYFLNYKIYNNENANSNVIYTELNNYKLLFMGDAPTQVEKDLLKKYTLKNITILKVGHHGSNTSSSKNFITEIAPSYALISVGKDNRYNHPHKKTLKNLKNSQIYRTDLDGSTMFTLKNKKLTIESTPP